MNDNNKKWRKEKRNYERADEENKKTSNGRTNAPLGSFSNDDGDGNENRAVYTRENKPRLTLAAAYVSRERNYLCEYKLLGQDKTRLEKAVNVDFVPFIRGVRGLRKPRPELAAAYFLSYKRP